MHRVVGLWIWPWFRHYHRELGFWAFVDEIAALRMTFNEKARVSVPAAIDGDGDVAELKVRIEEVMDIFEEYFWIP